MRGTEHVGPEPDAGDRGGVLLLLRSTESAGSEFGLKVVATGDAGWQSFARGDEALLRPALPVLAAAAATLAATLLADWFRLDVFLGHPALGPRVNEITYPSHILDTGALAHWLRRYEELQPRPHSAEEVYERVAGAIGLDRAGFWDSDYNSSGAATEAARARAPLAGGAL